MSNQLPQEQLKSLSDLLVSTREKAKEILSHPENQVILAGVQSAFIKLLNKVNFLAGIAHSAHISAEQFEPIVIGAEPLPSPESVNSEEADREAFVAKVKLLYAQFETLSPEGLLNHYRSAEDQLILRGVAKLSGIEDYADAELNIEFIESVQAAIKEKASEDARQQEIDAQLQAQLSVGTDHEPDEELPILDEGDDIPIPGIDTPAPEPVNSEEAAAKPTRTRTPKPTKGGTE